MHNHFTPGWQDMSPDDVGMERDSLLGPGKATGHPVVGLTVGTDGTWSARRWIRAGGRAHRQWARTVRTVGSGRFRMTFLPSMDDGERRADIHPTHRRTIQGLGDLGFRRLRQLSVAVVGVGSVGSIVAEALARMKVRELLLVDFDKVEEHNLDRLLHATRWDIGRCKVDVAGSRIDHNFPSGGFRILRADIRDEPVFRSIADCDIVLACVDKPIARDLLNHLAITHVVPVIEGGVFLEATQGALARGQVTARVIYPGAECLRCAGQYSLDGVSLEVQGLLDDPKYLRTTGGFDSSVGANTFAASLLTAGEQLELLVRFVAGADWWPVVNEVRHDLKFGRALPRVGSCSQTCDMVDKQRKGSPAEPTWLLRGRAS